MQVAILLIYIAFKTTGVQIIYDTLSEKIEGSRIGFTQYYHVESNKFINIPFFKAREFEEGKTIIRIDKRLKWDDLFDFRTCFGSLRHELGFVYYNHMLEHDRQEELLQEKLIDTLESHGQKIKR